MQERARGLSGAFPHGLLRLLRASPCSTTNAPGHLQEAVPAPAAPAVGRRTLHHRTMTLKRSAAERAGRRGDNHEGQEQPAVADRPRRGRERTSNVSFRKPWRAVESVEKARSARTGGDKTAVESVRLRGLEPRTCGLRVRCSAIELEAHRAVYAIRARRSRRARCACRDVPSVPRRSSGDRNRAGAPAAVGTAVCRRVISVPAAYDRSTAATSATGPACRASASGSRLHSARRALRWSHG
jgi:hypothetical protein